MIFRKKNARCAAQVDQDHSAFSALHGDVHEFAFAALEVFEDDIAFRFADFLHDHLLRGLRGHAPERGRDRKFHANFFFELRVWLDVPRVAQHDHGLRIEFRPLVFHLARRFRHRLARLRRTLDAPPAILVRDRADGLGFFLRGLRLFFRRFGNDFHVFHDRLHVEHADARRGSVVFFRIEFRLDVLVLVSEIFAIGGGKRGFNRFDHGLVRDVFLVADLLDRLGNL